MSFSCQTMIAAVCGHGSGFLTPPGDADAIAAHVEQLLEDDKLRQRMGEKAAESARKRLDLERQTKEYLQGYDKITNEWQEAAPSQNR